MMMVRVRVPVEMMMAVKPMNANGEMPGGLGGRLCRRLRIGAPWRGGKQDCR